MKWRILKNLNPEDGDRRGQASVLTVLESKWRVELSQTPEAAPIIKKTEFNPGQPGNISIRAPSP